VGASSRSGRLWRRHSGRCGGARGGASADVTASLIYRWRGDLRARRMASLRCWWRRLVMASPLSPEPRDRDRIRWPARVRIPASVSRLWRRLSSRRSRDHDPVPSGVRVWLAVVGPTCATGMNGLRYRFNGVGLTRMRAIFTCSRGARGDMLKIVWHDGSQSLYAKRLERGRFIWPSTTTGCCDQRGAVGLYA